MSGFWRGIKRLGLTYKSGLNIGLAVAPVRAFMRAYIRVCVCAYLPIPKNFCVFIRPMATPQDWRAAVREETAAAVKSVAATSGGGGDGLGGRNVGDGAGGGGIQQGAPSGSSSGSNRLGEVDPSSGGSGGARDKVHTRLSGYI